MVVTADGVDDLPDDLVAASLLGAHAHLALRRGRAVRYRLDVSPFAALPPDAGEGDWADLAALTRVPHSVSRAKRDGEAPPTSNSRANRDGVGATC